MSSALFTGYRIYCPTLGQEVYIKVHRATRYRKGTEVGIKAQCECGKSHQAKIGNTKALLVSASKTS